jgi:pimeloyl-ACP methyl ester carboxylesterase
MLRIAFRLGYWRISAMETLIVHGDRDEYFPVGIALEQFGAIPHSYLWVFPNAGHPPYIGSDRDLAIFMETTMEFLQGGWWEPVAAG